MPLQSGDKLGPYEILAPVGAGGMGEVYRAHDPRLGRDVAIKVSAQQFSDRFEREARAIAVLPFANMGADKENEYFSDGLAEEILNLLAKIKGLKVIARTSSFAFRGKEQGIVKIAETLRVATILEGSLRRAGSRIRVTAQLIDAADGSHLWSERYDRELLEFNPNVGAAIGYLALQHVARGELDQAAALIEKGYAISPTVPNAIGAMAGILKRMSHDQRSEEVLRPLLHGEAFGAPRGLAVYHWVPREFDAVEEWIGKVSTSAIPARYSRSGTWRSSGPLLAGQG